MTGNVLISVLIWNMHYQEIRHSVLNWQQYVQKSAKHAETSVKNMIMNIVRSVPMPASNVPKRVSKPLKFLLCKKGVHQGKNPVGHLFQVLQLLKQQ
ncbi:hypothetical protein AAT16_01535 [Salinicoccus halodurans]|uniref:Uncharacterized protein n=1 Tax=Salinicoccus halodurans TaxID=407035 RepID=A0ABM5T642_9STAP|nr:hypothetical protein AAT16_01535 [Salinicoccus halodurans]